MPRKPAYERCERRYLPTRLKAEIILRQDGRCADCGTRLILGFFVFDHRPALGLRDKDEDANDPERLAAICWTCDEQKTPKDIKEIAKAKRIAEKHQDFINRQSDKVPGRRVPSRKQVLVVERAVGRALGRSIARPLSLPPLVPIPKSDE